MRPAGTLAGTSALSTSSRGRRLALGAASVVTVGLVSAYASTIGAQTTSEPIRLEVVSVDAAGVVQDLPVDVVPAISDTAAIVAYETAPPTPGASPNTGNPADSLDDRRVTIRDRDGETTRAVAELGSTAPGVSGNGCVVAYSVIGADVIELTVLDRCATPSDQALPIGSVLDTVTRSDVPGAGGPGVAAPALSFDGSVVVWSTGQEVRRYVRSTTGGFTEPPVTFDVVAGGAADVVTGARVDVSADGRNVVFVAGPGTDPYAPSPANVYVWTAPASQLDSPPEPELLSTTMSGDPAAGDSASPTISADGTFVVFESTALDLAVVGATPVTGPFVIGADRTTRTSQILLDDATRPAISADGNHIVYQRGDALRVLSSDATSPVDVTIDELAGARPTGPAAISQFGRWLVFASAEALAPDLVDPARPAGTTVVWAADRSSSNGGTVDTTTTTTTTPTTPTQPPPTSPPVTQPPGTPPPDVPATTSPDVASAPGTTLPIGVIVARYPTGFPSVPFTAPPRRSSTSSSSTSNSNTFRPSAGTSFGGVTSASASPVSFGPTVVGAGRRTQPVTLLNSGTSASQVSVASIDVPEAFTIVSDGCSGASIGPGASCVVEVQFAPIAVGPANGSLVFQFSDGSIVTASLVGDGVAGPTLGLVPAVAGAGQTVTVFGAGFPPGSTIGLSQPGAAAPVPIVVDADGTFAHVVVVLTNTPPGPTELAVPGQPDAYDAVTVELLVSTGGAATGDIAVRSGPSSPLGR